MSPRRSISEGFDSNIEKSCTPAGSPRRKLSKRPSASPGRPARNRLDRTRGSIRAKTCWARTDLSAG